MKYTELPNDELILLVNAGAQALLTPGNAVNLTHIRELIIETERRQKIAHANLQVIKAEMITPKEELKKQLESAAELGRLALKHDIERNGETVPGITLIVDQPVPELPLVDHPAYKRLVVYLRQWCPSALKTTIDNRAFKAWYAAHHQVDADTLEADMADLGVAIVEPTHVRLS